MSFAEKIVVAKISAKVMNSFEVMQFIYKMKGSIVALFSVNLMYRSPTKIPNRDKKTESPYLVHPLTYRQVYLTKDAYFVEKIHCELVEMAVGQRMNKIWFSCHKIYWFGFLVTIRNFRRAPVPIRCCSIKTSF